MPDHKKIKPYWPSILSAAILAVGCLAGLTGAAQARPTLAGVEDRPLVASWYGANHHGRATASGEVFDRRGFTAAHRSLPFGTRLRVTNLQNGRTALVRVNDRGPHRRGRDLDVSEAAAAQLGVAGRGLVVVSAVVLPNCSSEGSATAPQNCRGA
jgi:rare lipoprotein A